MERFDDLVDFDLPDEAQASFSEDLQGEDEYDAINDETFGGELNDLDGDLEEFANRTAGLLLDEPSCSSKAESSVKVINGTWSEKDIVPLMAGAKTLEEIEKEQVHLGKIRAQCGTHSPVQPSLSLHNELRNMTQWQKVNVSSTAGVNPNVSVDFSLPPPQLITPTQSHVSPHVIPYGGPNLLNKFTMNQNFSRVPGSWMSDKNGTPPPNGVHRSYSIRSNNLQRGNRNLQNQSPYRQSYYDQRNDNNVSAQQHRGSTLSLISTNSNMTYAATTTSGRNNRPKGLPSTRTISDFAFDPYAGFMSKKEREWLIKIHLIQCTNIGNTSEDDYYYTIWKKRNVLKKQPNGQKLQPQYYSFEDTYPSAAYVPPIFSGSLGRPTHCSAKVPRQLIDLPVETMEDDGGRNTQKKLKAILMRIENAAIMLIACDSLKRELSIATSPEELEETKAKIRENLENITTLICSDEFLPVLMMIQKGRTFLFQLLDFCDVDDMFGILKTVIETLRKYAKKVPDDAVLEFGKRFYALLFALSRDQVLKLLTCFNVATDLSGFTKLEFTFILVYLTVSAKLNVDAMELASSAIYDWLQYQTSSDELIHILPLTPNIEEIFSKDDLLMLKKWLNAYISDEQCINNLLIHYIDGLTGSSLQK